MFKLKLMDDTGNKRVLIKNAAVVLFICGAAALFWELTLIRWLSSTIRIVAYYSNFVLISAFFGLGAGALCARFRVDLNKLIFYALALCILIGPVLGSFPHTNPARTVEFVWNSVTEAGFKSHTEQFYGLQPETVLPYWLILAAVYAANSFLFMVFGQWLGNLFKTMHPLKAYTIEIGGSIVGILLFTLLAAMRLSPSAWFFAGFLMLLAIMEFNKKTCAAALISALSIYICVPFIGMFFWSPYYKIHVKPSQIMKIGDNGTNQSATNLKLSYRLNYQLTVNNDYLQNIGELSTFNLMSDGKKALSIYERPYEKWEGEPEGDILILGAGGGNDVAAALSSTKSRIDAVEIDPTIIYLGMSLHPARPYHDPRVMLINDDARAYFAKSKKKYAKVVFGYLDSHTLMSSFSSLRLESFVYTYESFKKAKELLLPGGTVVVSHAAPAWVQERIVNILNDIFDYPTEAYIDGKFTPIEKVEHYVTYRNRKKPDDGGTPTAHTSNRHVRVPTDNWPFIYMRTPSLPDHYKVFIVMAVVLGLSSFFLLPAGERKLRLPYFFMGGAFFLIETSNVISLSLLYGSTWVVNVTVFTGILTLILSGNLLSYKMQRRRFTLIFGLLFLSLALSYLTQPSLLLGLNSLVLKSMAAVMIFLSPVFFASLIFAELIKNEKDLSQAYGSNLLGAVIGGTSEYVSLIMGIKFLLIITIALYLLTYIFIKAETNKGMR
ncbi:MAG: hypothetical protein HQL01_07615 [Nitrospirae bacterium]|nr:hypothetical protein [Nitrospirota bacterium]